MASGRWSNQDLAERIAANPALRISGHSPRKIASPTPVAVSAVSNAANSPTLQPLVFTVPGSPVPKPRQTRADKWKKRPAVLRYRAWADSARAERDKAKRAAFPVVRFMGMLRYGRVYAVAYFKMPGSWNHATKARMQGQPHCLRPDADNLMKAIGDSLWPTGDEHLYDLHVIKLWDDGAGARTVITLY